MHSREATGRYLDLCRHLEGPWIARVPRSANSDTVLVKHQIDLRTRAVICRLQKFSSLSGGEEIQTIVPESCEPAILHSTGSMAAGHTSVVLARPGKASV